MTRYLNDPAQWGRLAEALLRAGSAGIDSETDNQPDGTSPQFRADIVVWSLGVLGQSRHPRGYRRATGVVLPRAALHSDALRAALSSVRLVAHNAPHDYHSFRNAGLDLPRMVDTLQPLRVLVPGMANYGLKAAERWALGKPSRPEYRDFVHYRATVPVLRGHTVSRCACGNVPCRKRSTAVFLDPDGLPQYHTRADVRVETTEMVERALEYSIRDLTPGAVLAPLTWTATKRKPHPPGWWRGIPLDRLAEWWDYAAADAISAAELDDWMTNLRDNPRKVTEYPWVSPSAYASPSP